jgi:hypothetical protein
MPLQMRAIVAGNRGPLLLGRRMATGQRRLHYTSCVQEQCQSA